MSRTAVADCIGSEIPRVWTRPLRELTPATSDGFRAIEFAEGICGLSLLPWQKWWLIHALELLPDGSFRYRTILTLIARQNGKTFLLKVLALFFMYVLRTPLVLGSAQDLKIARESWRAAYDLAASVPDLSAELAPPTRRGLPPGRRDSSGEETMILASADVDLTDEAALRIQSRRYVVSATSRGAGRGRSVDLLIMDEVREQRDMLAWAALSKTTMARPNSLKALISNAGDDGSMLLNHIHARATSMEAEDIAVFEWSAPEGCALDDPQAWAQANPALGHTISVGAIREALGTDPPEVFRTEVLCQRVSAMDVLVPEAAWEAGADPHLTLDPWRARVVLAFDVAPSGQHATLVAAARRDDGRIVVEPVAAWTDMTLMRSELAMHVNRVRPGLFGWYGEGPAKAYATLLKSMRGSREIRGPEVTQSCEGLVATIKGGRLVHGADPLLAAHILGAKAFTVSDGFRFARRGVGNVDAAYATAGAVFLAESARDVSEWEGRHVI